MSVRLGTVAPIGFPDFPPRPWLGCMRELGCRVAQVYRNQKASVSVAQIREALEAGGMPCDSIHGIYGEEYDPSAPDEAARRFAVDTYKKEGDLAAQLGGPLVVVHCSTIRREGISAAERRQRLAQLQKSMLDLGRYGQSIGVRYAFENLPAYHAVGSSVADIAACIAGSGAPSVGICFDVGHANMVCDPAAAVAQADGRIVYVHFNDNNGHADDHLMPSLGRADMVAVGKALRAAGYEGTLMLEVFYGTEDLRRLVGEGLGERLKELVAVAGGA